MSPSSGPVSVTASLNASLSPLPPARQHSSRAALLSKLFPLIAFPLSLALLLFTATVPMSWRQQAVAGVLLMIAAWLLHRVSKARFVNLVLAAFSLCATARYIFWRFSVLYAYLHSPWSHTTALSACLMIPLLAAETYAAVILVLGYVQTVAPLQRSVLPLDTEPSAWPTVDILIPTYNESLDVVRYGVLAAQEIEWPKDKINIFLLDDGERDEFEQFAREIGIHYIARTEHSGAKAGNLNNALDQTVGEYVVVFDCDHIPTRSFLKSTVGWFLQDAALGLLQTPHHFYSPDPFERNLKQFRKIPNEGNLFYGIVQDANDLWNATFFCGSCAILRRSALEEIGGIAVDTVTEDAHTSLRMQRRGWGTAYINLPMAAGLATETLTAHVSQRIRWARGMAQILRIDNPLFGRGLKLTQRLCYFNATLHYLYGIPRLLFLTAPLLFLIFGISNVPGYWAAILAFALPHLLLSNLANSRIQGSHRHSFWNEIYETILTPYILLPTTIALIAPKHGAFNVTAKGGLQSKDHFDHGIARPFCFLAALNVFGLCMAVPRYLYWDPNHAGTIVINVFWTLFNLVILGAALAVCREKQQRRHANRVECKMPVRLHSADGAVQGSVLDLSTGGLAIQARGQWKAGTHTQVEFMEGAESIFLDAAVVRNHGRKVCLRFMDGSYDAERRVTRVLYSADHRWIDWYQGQAKDRPLRSLLHIFGIAIQGYWKLFRSLRTDEKKTLQVETAARSAAIVGALLLAAWLGCVSAHAAPVGEHAQAASITQAVSLNIPGREGALLEQAGSQAVIRFSVPDTWFVRSGLLRLRYDLPHSSSGADGTDSVAEVRLNDVVLGSLTPTAQERASGHGAIDISLPAEMLVRKNTLTIQLAGNANTLCAPVGQHVAPVRIDMASQLLLQAEPLHLVNDLSALPHPFLEHLGGAAATVPMVFGRQPGARTLQAAGVLASWFGSKDEDARVHFPSSIRELPKGNAVLLLIGNDQVDGVYGRAPGPMSITITENPADPYGKLLVLYGASEDDLLAAAQATVLQQKSFNGTSAALLAGPLPEERRPDDAPRWIHANRIPLYDLLPVAERRTSGHGPVNVYMHLAPDYNFGAQQQMYLHLAYQTSGKPMSSTSSVDATLNGATLDSYPMRSTGRPESLNVPMVDVPVATYANTLQVQFYFVQPGAGCKSSNEQAGADLLGSSYLDLGNAVHFTQLPNLKLFAKAGFPFTRFADLGNTAVLLPALPSAKTIDLYLDLMGYFGANTGYPALRVQVGSIEASGPFENKDLLVLGTYSDLAASPALTSHLPAQFTQDGAGFSAIARLGLLKQWTWQDGWTGITRVLHGDGMAADGVIAGYESPLAAGRTVVAVLSRSEENLPAMASAMLEEMPGDAIADTVTLWSDGSFRSYPLLTSTYSLTTLPWYQAIRYAIPQSPLLACLALMVAFIALAAWAHCWIRVLIQKRLQGTTAAAMPPAGGSHATATPVQ